MARHGILVGNIGYVHAGTSKRTASKVYNAYVRDSKRGVGRGAGEDVTWFIDDEIYREHWGESAMPKYEIINHGYYHCQYFQGCSTAFTDFDYSETGCGMNAKEAYEDAVESIYQTHGTAEVERLKLPTRPRGIRKSDKVPADAHEEVYYYVSIRYSL